jgi:hypothetical protein
VAQSGHSLKQRINQALGAVLVTTDEAAEMHRLREEGNQAAHGDLGAFGSLMADTTARAAPASQAAPATSNESSQLASGTSDGGASAALDEVEAWLHEIGLGRVAGRAAWTAEWSEMHCYASMASSPSLRTEFELEMELRPGEVTRLGSALQAKFGAATADPGRSHTPPRQGSVASAIVASSSAPRPVARASSSRSSSSGDAETALTRSITPVEAWLQKIGLGASVAQAASNHDSYCEMEDFEDMVAGPSASLLAQDEAEAKLRACIAALELDDAQAQTLRSGLVSLRPNSAEPQHAPPGGYS